MTDINPRTQQGLTLLSMSLIVTMLVGTVVLMRMTLEKQGSTKPTGILTMFCMPNIEKATIASSGTFEFGTLQVNLDILNCSLKRNR